MSQKSKQAFHYRYILMFELTSYKLNSSNNSFNGQIADAQGEVAGSYISYVHLLNNLA